MFRLRFDDEEGEDWVVNKKHLQKMGVKKKSQQEGKYWPQTQYHFFSKAGIPGWVVGLGLVAVLCA